MAKTFDSKQVTVYYNGLLLEGYAPGDFLTVERDEDMFTKSVGASGASARAKTNNAGGMITLRLLQTSESNDELSALALLDEQSNLGSGALMIKDNSGTMLVVCDDAWIKKLPTVTLGTEISVKEWVFDCGNLQYNAGSN